MTEQAKNKTKEKVTDEETLARSMTLEEACCMLSGQSFWYTQGIDHLGIEPIMLTDGSNGLRKQTERTDHLGQNPSVPATCFPSEAALASSWDERTAYDMGRAIGVACRKENVSVLLGPGVNIKRSPLCGRNFEYFSEDPYLSSHMAAAYIRGVQSMGVGSCVKHYAVNNQETHRLTVDAVVDERTLREIYLESFRYAITEGAPWMVMSAYNRVNGVPASESDYLLRRVLRDEWHFSGVVVTDWGGVSDRKKGLAVGEDLEMPYSGGIYDHKIKQAVKSGEITRETVDRSVMKILRMVQSAQNGRRIKIPADLANLDAQHEMAVKIGEECVVLLKNDEALLPLHVDDHIAVIGEFAEHPRFQGGGSAHTNPARITNARAEIEKRCPNVCYAQGYHINSGKADSALLKQALTTAENCDAVVVFAGLPEQYETEGIDRKHLNLPAPQNELIEELTRHNKNVIVVLSNGAPVLMPWKNRVKSIVEGYLLGQATGEVIAKIILGEINPSGKLAETFPTRLEDTPCYLDFPGTQGSVHYRENIFVGYRWYDVRNIKPLFEFGYGLSYTSFDYSEFMVDREEVNENETVTVSVRVKNVGEMAGKEVVQLYVHDRQTGIQRPEKELKGFSKVFLQPGEERTVQFKLDWHAFACFDAQCDSWVIQNGKFDLLVGKSSRDIMGQKTVQVHSTVPRKLCVTRRTSFGEIWENMHCRKCAERLMMTFKRESGIDFNLGDNVKDFARTVISGFPLQALVTFSKGRFSEEELQCAIDDMNRSQE